MAESKEYKEILPDQWKPEAPAGLNFSYVIPDSFTDGYQTISNQDHDQGELTTKMRSSRLRTRRHSKVLRTCSGLSFLAEKRFRDAANNGDYEMIERLLSEGIDVSCSDTKKRTALHIASAKGNHIIVNTLLNNGAKTNLKDVNGNTPLHLAACSSHIKIITTLVEFGAEVNALDECGRSPLQLAFSRLRLIEEDEIVHSKAREFKNVVMEVVKMLQVCLSKTGHVEEEQRDLNELCEKLEKTTTVEQVDEVHDLLSSFTSMSLTRRGFNKT